MKIVSIVLALSAIILTGCHTPRTAAAWEYRFYDRHGLGDTDKGLNKLASDGWVVQSFTVTPDNHYTFLLKKPKR